MAQHNTPFKFVADTEASADEVNINFETLRTFVNNSLMHRDGSKSMTGHLNLAADAPTHPLHAASKGYVDLKATEAPSWAGGEGTTATHGAMPGIAGTKLRIAGGRNSGQTDGFGRLHIVFPPGAFPNGIISAQATFLSDQGANQNSVLNIRDLTKTSMYAQARFDAGGFGYALAADQFIMVSWLVVGW